jgi:Uma2 family endonuclease
MTTIATTPIPTIPEPGEVSVFDDVSWEFYEQLVENPEFYHVRVTYDQGRMTLMSPLPIHDKIKSLAGRLLEFATFELDIPISSFGSTTWKRQDLKRGLEPDECYYITSEPLVRGRTDIVLKKDPPSDLAIEVDITHNPIARQSIYAALGVSELWRYDGSHFHFHRRISAKTYEEIAVSDQLPFMTPQIVDRFTTLMLSDENGGLKEFRKWLKPEQPASQQ